MKYHYGVERQLHIGVRNQLRCWELFPVEAMVQDYGRLYEDLLGTGK